MPPIDNVHGVVHLRHIGLGARVQGLLHHRLFGTRLTTKGRVQAGVRPQAFVDLHQAVRTCQERDKGIIQFLDRGVDDCLLSNVDVVTHRPKQVEPLQS